MLKRNLRIMIDFFVFCAIALVLYIGYCVFFNKPSDPAEMTNLYIKMGYAFLALFTVLLIRIILRRLFSKDNR